MKLPGLSHLQFLVLEALGTHRLSGRELRERLHTLGVGKSNPAFYQLMSRLEESKFVEGETEKKMVEGIAIKERFYKLTGHGASAYHETLAFYREREIVKVPGGLPA